MGCALPYTVPQNTPCLGHSWVASLPQPSNSSDSMHAPPLALSFTLCYCLQSSRSTLAVVPHTCCSLAALLYGYEPVSGSL